MNDLIKQEDIDKQVVFGGNGMKSLLHKIHEQTAFLVPDLETEKGRKEIASLARKVSSSKVMIDDIGKELVSKWKELSKSVDGDRKLARDYLDNLRDEIRKPLTEWEDQEKDRIAAEALIIEIQAAQVEAIEYNDFLIKQAEIEARENEIRKREIEIEEQQRAEQERIEQADREMLENERQEQIKKQAEIAAKEKAEREAQEKIDQVKREADEKVRQAEQAEKDRLQREAEEKEAEEKRLRNTRHKGKINAAISKDLVAIGVNPITAKKAVELIAKGKISNISITY